MLRLLLFTVLTLSLMTILRKRNEAFWHIQEWCTHWHLDIQADKSAAICFSRSSYLPEINIHLHGVYIVWTSHKKVLGLILSSNVTFRADFRYLLLPSVE